MSLADLCGIGSSGDLGASDAGIFASDGEDGDLEGNSFANGRVICGDLGNESPTFERLGPEADWPKDCFGKKSDEGDEGTRLGSNPPAFRKQLRDWRKASCNGSGFSNSRARLCSLHRPANTVAKGIEWRRSSRRTRRRRPYFACV